MRPKIYLEPVLEQDFEPLKIKQQLNSDVKSAFFMDSSASLAQAVFDDAPKEFVEYSEMTMEEAVGMKVQTPEDAQSFPEEEL
jgi:hypothetical protein